LKFWKKSTPLSRSDNRPFPVEFRSAGYGPVSFRPPGLPAQHPDDLPGIGLFPLFLIFGIAFTGIFMRYFAKIDVTAAKELSYGLVSFSLPSLAKMQGIGSIFYIHVFFVSVLLVYFPWSKLMHMGGIFLSPTRNMANNTRAVRHVNPWNYPVNVHTYEEYEDDFREKMIEAGLPVDKKE
jgi:nitrate reductase gamma subunit